MATDVKQTSGKRRVGDGTPGPGRPRGSTNKVPAEIKKAIGLALDGFAPRIPGLLEEVAKKDPARALEIVARLSEYAVPKLSRLHATSSGLTLEQLVLASGLGGFRAEVPVPTTTAAEVPAPTLDEPQHQQYTPGPLTALADQPGAAAAHIRFAFDPSVIAATKAVADYDPFDDM